MRVGVTTAQLTMQAPNHDEPPDLVSEREDKVDGEGDPFSTEEAEDPVNVDPDLLGPVVIEGVVQGQGGKGQGVNKGKGKGHGGKNGGGKGRASKGEGKRGGKEGKGKGKEVRGGTKGKGKGLARRPAAARVLRFKENIYIYRIYSVASNRYR